MNDEEERKGWQAGKVYGCQLWVPGGIQSRLTDDWLQWVCCFLSVRHPGIIPVYQKNSCTLLFSGIKSSWNLVSPLLRKMKRWRMNVLLDNNPWQINTKPRQHQTFAIEKFRNSIVTIRSWKKNFRNRKIPKFDRNNPITSWGQKTSNQNEFEIGFSGLWAAIIFSSSLISNIHYPCLDL